MQRRQFLGALGLVVVAPKLINMEPETVAKLIPIDLEKPIPPMVNRTMTMCKDGWIELDKQVVRATKLKLRVWYEL